MSKAILACSLLAFLAVNDSLNESFVDAVLAKERIVANVMRNEVQPVCLDISKSILLLDMYLVAVNVYFGYEELKKVSMRQMRDDLPQRLVVVEQLLYFLHFFRVVLHRLVDLKCLL